MPKCKCTHCLNLTNGKGKNLHRTTVTRHMEKEKIAQSLENEYMSLHYEENLREEESSYEENEQSFMEICDNEEEKSEQSPMEMCDNDDILMEETNDNSNFQNEENENTNDHYENDYYYENDYLIYDSRNESESESDNVNYNADNEEGEFQNKLLILF